MFCFFFKQKTAYEMRISDWSSDVCSSDLPWRACRQMLDDNAIPVPARCERDVINRDRFAAGRGDAQCADARVADRKRQWQPRDRAFVTRWRFQIGRAHV